MTTFSNQRLEERKDALEKLDVLKRNSSKINVIHYSCESFYHTNGRTPRVTAICIKNKGNGSSHVFSIHTRAQIAKKELCCLSSQDFDLLERQMLEDFYKYVRSHKTDYWLHWNMRNTTYGFDAIANRYKILGGNPIDVEDRFRCDLNNLLFALYTSDFEFDEPNGRMLNLADRNKITVRDALIGKEEGSAFDQRDYQKLYMSTARKIEIIDRIMDLTIKNKLLVKTPAYKIYGLSVPGMLEIIKNSWVLTLLVSVGLYILGIVSEDFVKGMLAKLF